MSNSWQVSSALALLRHPPLSPNPARVPWHRGLSTPVIWGENQPTLHKSDRPPAPGTPLRWCCILAVSHFGRPARESTSPGLARQGLGTGCGSALLGEATLLGKMRSNCPGKGNPNALGKGVVKGGPWRCRLASCIRSERTKSPVGDIQRVNLWCCLS